MFLHNSKMFHSQLICGCLDMWKCLSLRCPLKGWCAIFTLQTHTTILVRWSRLPSLCQTLPLSSVLHVSPYSWSLEGRFRDAHAEQSECAHTLVCLGLARCWEDLLLQQNREVTVQAPFNRGVLSGAKQNVWHLDLVRSEHIKGEKQPWMVFLKLTVTL